MALESKITEDALLKNKINKSNSSENSIELPSDDKLYLNQSKCFSFKRGRGQFSGSKNGRSNF